MFETYKPSGRFGGLSIAFILIGMIAAVAASYVYHLLLHWIPLIYVNFLATIGLGFLLGFFGAMIVNIGKVRNVPLALVIGLLLTLAALGGKFYFQYEQMLSDTVQVLMNDPQAIGADPAEMKKFLRQEISFMDHIQVRVDEGWNIGRGGGGAPVSGIFVYAIWLIEFGIVVWSAATVALGAAREPFSEKLGEWASESEIVMTLPVTNDDMVAQIKAATTVDQLLEIPIPQTDASDQFAVYTVNSIPGQELEDAYLTVELNRIYLDKEGNQQTDVTPLVQLAIITTDQRKQLFENADLLNEAMADYREAVESGEMEEGDGQGVAESESDADGYSEEQDV